VTCPSLCQTSASNRCRPQQSSCIPKHNFKGRDESIRVIVMELHTMLGTKILRNFMQGWFSLDVGVHGGGVCGEESGIWRKV
jgi:hypothetical protein